MQLYPIWSVLGLMGLFLIIAVFLMLVLAWLSEKLKRWSKGSEPALPIMAELARSRPAPLTALPASASGTCSQCHAELPRDAPHGLCPRCLMHAALHTPTPEGAPAETSPYASAFTAPEPQKLAPHLPQLEILGLIGQGGMGAVYRARQVKLDRLVALKVLPAEWGRDPAFAERFGREARALARLTHPNVVAVHDFGEAGGYFYLLMEYVDGVNLRQRLHEGPLPPETALPIISQICDALQYAHDEGVIHRDIKPENILLDRRGRVRIADFGLAKLVGPSRASFTLTGTHQVMGTLDYMAPEQRSRPQEVDHRADIYSLGVLFYEMLTGDLPLGRFAPPSQVANVDGRIDAIVFRSLEREPEQRYQRVSDVKAELDTLVQAPAMEMLPGSPVPENVQLLVAGPAITLFATGICAVASGALALFGGLLVYVADGQEASHNMHMGDGPEAYYKILVALGGLAFVAMGAVILRGARNLRRLDNYHQIVFALILALVPIHAVIGVPAAIWCAWAMSRPEARAAFAANLRRRQAAASRIGRRTSTRKRRAVSAFFYSFRNLFFTSPESRAAVPAVRATNAAAEPSAEQLQ